MVACSRTGQELDLRRTEGQVVRHSPFDRRGRERATFPPFDACPNKLRPLIGRAPSRLRTLRPDPGSGRMELMHEAFLTPSRQKRFRARFSTIRVTGRVSVKVKHLLRRFTAIPS